MTPKVMLWIGNNELWNQLEELAKVQKMSVERLCLKILEEKVLPKKDEN